MKVILKKGNVEIINQDMLKHNISYYKEFIKYKLAIVINRIDSSLFNVVNLDSIVESYDLKNMLDDVHSSSILYHVIKTTINRFIEMTNNEVSKDTINYIYNDINDIIEYYKH